MGKTELTVEEEEIVIVGGGIAGLATAVALKRVGLHARVLERYPEHRISGAALGLFPNAWLALRALGVDHKLTSLYYPVKRSLATSLETGATQEFDFTVFENREKNVAVRSVLRKALLQALAEELPPDTVRFSSKLISIKEVTLEDSSRATLLHLEDGTLIKAKVVIGCDGVHSKVAKWLGLSEPMKTGWSAIRALSVFPEGHGLEMQFRQYFGSGSRVAFLPINSTEVFWFLVGKSSSSDEEIRKNPELILKEVTTNFARDFPSDFLTVARNTDLSTVTWFPVVFRAPWSIALGQVHTSNVTVAGDAMHPMTPDVAQGGGSALEDAVILARCLSQARGTPDWPEEALQRYVKERRWRMAWIVACAWFTGHMQQSGGTGWWSGVATWFRDRVFYKFILTRIVDSMLFDCGELCPPSSQKLHQG